MRKHVMAVLRGALDKLRPASGLISGALSAEINEKILHQNAKRLFSL
jgi:predicted TIM-barrel fold metal-dependent hydrolase